MARALEAHPLLGGALAALTAALIGACGGGGHVEAPVLPAGAKFAILPAAEDGGVEAGERRAPTAPLREGDVLRGSAVCRGGPLAIVLRVIELDGDEVRGSIEISSQRSGSSGTYKVSGSYMQSTRRLRLAAGDWVDEPDDLEAADLEGVLGPAGLQGRFGRPGCSSFTLAREGPR